MRNLFRTKTLTQLIADSDQPGLRLRRSLGPFHLMALGVGAIVGAGIYSMVGTAAAGDATRPGAGPALVISFVLVGIACGFAALCYAEFASMAPISGSAYSYAYATLGELMAWIIGWDLILEYAVGNVAVAISWSAYFQELMRGLGWEFPAWLGTDFRSAVQAAAQLTQAQQVPEGTAALGHQVLHDAAAFNLAPRILGLPLIFNLPAVGIVAFITWVLVRGIRESAGLNALMVGLKLVIILLFLVVGVVYVQPANWSPFAPNGFPGITSAAAIIFFAYIGFDAVSTAGEEAKNPQRDLPIGILGSLVVCTVIYLAVAVVLTGLIPWHRLQVADPLAFVFAERGVHWMAGLISVGALVATTSVLIPFQVGQPRIFFAMARDGLLPAWGAKVHPRFRTPHVTTILTGVFVAFFSGITNINEMADLTNIGTLFAFMVVAIGIVVLRRVDPDRVRPFRTPWVPWIPLAAIGSCGYLMSQLPELTWKRFGYWLAIGLVIYFSYGIRRSRLHAVSIPGTRET